MKVLTIVRSLRAALSRSWSVHPGSLVAGVALAGVVFLATSQVPPPKPPLDTWPPAKRDVVNLFENFNVGGPLPVVVPPGGVHVITSAPLNEWLTVTGFSVQVSTGFLLVGEEFHGAYTWKGYGAATMLDYDPAQAATAIGWTVRPGGSFVVKNLSAQTPLNINAYTLIGYESVN